MRKLILILLTSAAARTYGDIIPIDLGHTPRRLKKFEEIDTYFTLPSTLSGSMTFDFHFSDLIRILPEHATEANPPYYVLRFDTFVSAGQTFECGAMSAVTLDQFGNPMGPLEEIFTLGSGLINGSGNLVYAGLLHPAPGDTYGVRFSFDLPGEVRVQSAFFRIGAGYPKDLVLGNLPDTGSTIALFALAVGAVLLVSARSECSPSWHR